jgi:hypothetical protein
VTLFFEVAVVINQRKQPDSHGVVNAYVNAGAICCPELSNNVLYLPVSALANLMIYKCAASALPRRFNCGGSHDLNCISLFKSNLGFSTAWSRITHSQQKE